MKLKSYYEHELPAHEIEALGLTEGSVLETVFTDGKLISREVVYAFAHRKMIYESAKHHNAVFVGYYMDGNPRHAHKRSTAKEGTYKCNVSGSQPEFSFHWVGPSDRLYLFEAPIDLLSFICLHPEGWRRHSYAAACSVSDRVVFQMLQDNPAIRQVLICFDSDEPGQAAARRVSDRLFIHGIKSEILFPTHKDWNEDLLYREEESECRELQS